MTLDPVWKNTEPGSGINISDLQHCLTRAVTWCLLPQGEAVKEEPPDVADEEERDLQTPQPDEEEFRSLALSLYHGPDNYKYTKPQCFSFLKN